MPKPRCDTGVTSGDFDQVEGSDCLKKTRVRPKGLRLVEPRGSEFAYLKPNKIRYFRNVAHAMYASILYQFQDGKESAWT